jgi:predicted nucleic acid-binding Zn ribbon protein
VRNRPLKLHALHSPGIPWCGKEQGRVRFTDNHAAVTCEACLAKLRKWGNK